MNIDDILNELQEETNPVEQQELIRYIQTFKLNEKQQLRLKQLKASKLTINIPQHQPAKTNVSNIERLQSSLQQLHECEEYGQQTIDTLQPQTEQIRSMTGKTQTVITT